VMHAGGDLRFSGVVQGAYRSGARATVPETVAVAAPG
jgi:hypothetical protein